MTSTTHDEVRDSYVVKCFVRVWDGSTSNSRLIPSYCYLFLSWPLCIFSWSFVSLSSLCLVYTRTHTHVCTCVHMVPLIDSLFTRIVFLDVSRFRDSTNTLDRPCEFLVVPSFMPSHSYSLPSRRSLLDPFLHTFLSGILQYIRWHPETKGKSPFFLQWPTKTHFLTTRDRV